MTWGRPSSFSRLSRLARLSLTTAFSGLLLTAPGAPAHAKSGKIAAEKVPAWVHEAAARPVPATATDLVWLHDEKTVEPLATEGVRTVRRVVMKALRPAGLETAGSWTLYYRRGDTIETLKSWTIQPDGSCKTADAEDASADIPMISSSSLYEDSRSRTLFAPGQMVGSVIAYESAQIEKIDRGAESFWFGDPDRPTVFSRFSLKLPPDWGREATPSRAEGIAHEETKDGIVWTARDLAPLPREELAPSDRERLPCVWLRWWSPDGARGYRDWDAVGRWYEALSSSVLGESGEAAKIAERLRPAEPSKLLDSLERAFAFASHDVRYVSIQIGIGGYKPHSPASVCENRYGDCKDKSFLMRALAGGWGLKTYPVLVRVRDAGPVEPGVPSPAQFDHCIAAVALPDGIGENLWPTLAVEGVGRVVFLDSTARNWSAWNLPTGDQGTLGLLVHPGGGKLIRLPVQPPEAGSKRVALTGTVDERGKLVEATLVERWTGSEAASVRAYYSGRTAEQVRRTVLEDLQDRFPGATVAEHKIEGLDSVDAPVEETTRIAAGAIGARVENLLVLEPGKSTYGVVHRKLPPPPRKWPLDLDHAREETVEIVIAPPPGWTAEEIPQPVSIETADFRSRGEWAVEEGRLVFRRTARLITGEIPVARYAEFRDAVHRSQRADTIAVVFVRAGQ